MSASDEEAENIRRKLNFITDDIRYHISEVSLDGICKLCAYQALGWEDMTVTLGTMFSLSLLCIGYSNTHLFEMSASMRDFTVLAFGVRA